MGKHARMFRNVTANLGNEIVNAFNAEAARDYQDTKRLALDEVKVFNGQLNNLDEAYDNFGQMKNYMVNNPNLFPLNVPGANREQAVDKTLSLLFNEDMDLFLGKNIDVQEKLKKRFLSPIVTEADDPYIPTAEYYKTKQADIRNKIGQISKIKKTTDLLTTMGQFSDKMEFAEEDYKTSIATSFMTANAYGIMGKTPTSQAGKDLLQIDQISIIAHNARKITDREAKQTFITNKLRENGINLERLYMLESPVSAKMLAETFQNELAGLSNDVEEARTLYKAAVASNDPNSARVYQVQLEEAQNKLFTATNKYSGMVAKNYLGKFDFGQVVEPEKPTVQQEPTPPEPEKQTIGPNQFMYNGKVYDIPPRFRGQSLPETLKRALASQQDNIKDATP